MTIMPLKTIKDADDSHLEERQIVSLGTFFTGDTWNDKIDILVGLVVKLIFEFSLSQVYGDLFYRQYENVSCYN